MKQLGLGPWYETLEENIAVAAALTLNREESLGLIFREEIKKAKSKGHEMQDRGKSAKNTTFKICILLRCQLLVTKQLTSYAMYFSE